MALSAVFGMMQLSGDPVLLMVPLDTSYETIERMREELGLNDPLPVQYARFIGNAVQGDFGASLRQTGRPALSVVLERIPNSLLLTSVSMLVALVIALPLGTIAAVFRNSVFDRLSTLVSVLFQSIPNFWLGLMLIIFFAVQNRWLPTGGIGTWKHLVLPAATLAAYTAARIVRLTRSSLLDVLHADYIRTAKAKGLDPKIVVFKHALKNAAVPIITMTSLQFGVIFGGAVIAETIFSWPGIGRLVVQSLEFRDFPVLLASVFFISLMFSLINLITDLLYALVNPEIRFS